MSTPGAMPERLFARDDARLLYSVMHACRHHGTATFAGIFAAEDGINRSAPTFDELASGLGILTSASLVEGDRDAYLLTPKGERILEQIEQIGGTVHQNILRLTDLLNAQLGPVATLPLELDPQAVQSAYDAYYRSD